MPSAAEALLIRRCPRCRAELRGAMLGDRCPIDDFFLVAPQALARGDGDPVLGLAAGARFGVVGLRSTGAHAAVYDAWDAAQKGACVLKIARCERHALGRDHDLFLREARLMQAAPGAVETRGVGAHEREPSFAFLAMDVARGEVITESPAPIELRARAALATIAALHAAGVVHGDVKPAHLLFDGKRVSLLDFGSAALAGEVGDAAREMTPAYAAPERETAGPTAASDVYSLGCVLFELAAGRRPFAGLSGDALTNAHAKQPVACDELPAALRRAVAAALEKRPGGRPEARELLSALG